MAMDHAKRSMLQATYTPIGESKEDRVYQVRTKRSYEKAVFAASLKMTRAESAVLRKRFGKSKKAMKAIEAMESATTAEGTPFALSCVPHFAEVDPRTMARVAERLVEFREREVDSLLKFQETTVQALVKAEMPLGAAHLGMHPMVREGTIEGATTNSTRLRNGDKGVLPGRIEFSVKGLELAGHLTPSELSLKAVMEWAEKKGIRSDLATRTLEMAAKIMPVRSDEMTIGQFKSLLPAYGSRQRGLVYGFQQRMAIEPVGFLHLERLSFTPAGIERGELVYSLPLAPDEEVNISHKEWSNTSEEFTKIVTDFVEAYSEEGVTEKSELAQATSSQNQHSSGFNTGVTASGEYGGVNITASVGYSVANSANHSEQFSRNQSAMLTRKASSRTKREHKVSFKVASAAGTEDQAVRKIKNPFSDKATRVDYFQLMRKWKVDLYRYGIRLTYDITIPDPGSGILSRMQEIENLRAALEEGFGSPDAEQAWARFDLGPSDVTIEKLATILAKYNASVEPPPPLAKPMITSEAHNWATENEAERRQITAVEVVVPEDYAVKSATLVSGYSAWIGHADHDNVRGDHTFQVNDLETRDLSYPDEINEGLKKWEGKSGKLHVFVTTRYVAAFSIEITLELVLRPEVLRAWQLKAWAAVRDAAEARYQETRQMAKERLARLTEELVAQDALSLRKIEREEIMKGAMRILLGPTFTFVSPVISGSPYDQWGEILSHGELIKFLHQAVEWENMLYFLYPYFWSSTPEFKKYLNHPDFMHRAFLKSGSARVVLTIRPGFEKDFVSLLEMGGFNLLTANHPYLKITEEMQDYAKTNYPGIRPANPIEDARPLIVPSQRRAWAEMQVIMKLLDAYFQAHGKYPSTKDGLAALKENTSPAVPSVPTKDPWGHDYVYTSPGTHGDYDLVSYGADSAPGGTDENADITSWAEASLIGTWYEYTPTSAMDIAFNTTLPDA